VPPLELVRLGAGESPVMKLGGGHAGVILVGLESEGPDRAERTRQMVTELNWSRDRLPDLVRGPLVLVVSQRVQTELFEQAPDFYSWRTHSTSITPQPRRPGEALPVNWLGIEDTDPEDPDVLESMIAHTEALRPPALRELGRLYLRLASARSRRGEYAAVDAALDVAHQAYASAGTPDDRANLLLLRGEVARRRGRVDEASDWLNRARSEARSVSPTPHVVAKLQLFELLLALDREEWTAALADRLAVVAVRLDAAGRPTRADVARGYRGLVLERLGRHAEARAEWTTALAGFDTREQAEPAEYLRKLLAESDAHRD
jgi:tetratricopeptide (TPR) repeat protein